VESREAIASRFRHAGAIFPRAGRNFSRSSFRSSIGLLVTEDESVLCWFVPCSKRQTGKVLGRKRVVFDRHKTTKCIGPVHRFGKSRLAGRTKYSSPFSQAALGLACSQMASCCSEFEKYTREAPRVEGELIVGDKPGLWIGLPTENFRTIIRAGLLGSTSNPIRAVSLCRSTFAADVVVI
jgi:hypothetical protein